jgi:iron-sulfur cluster repair protein YtfE (RIC family)
MSAIDTTSSAQEYLAAATARDDRLAAELAQATELLYSIMRVHGPVHPELCALVPAVTRLGDVVASQLHTAPEASPAGIGEAVTQVRTLTGGYDASRAVCRTHRRLLETLADLERDLRRRTPETEPRP